MQKYFGRVYSLMRPLLFSGILAVTGCADTVLRTEYEASRTSDAETIRLLREDLATTRNHYEKSFADLKILVTERTSIDELIPKIGEAKEDLSKQLQIEKDKLEKTRRAIIVEIERQKSWFKQIAEPAIGKPENAEGPSTGIYADRQRIDNHETRLGNQKRAYQHRGQNLEYERTVDVWSYGLYLEYRKPIDQGRELLQRKLDALNSAKPEERAAASESFDREAATFEKNIELLIKQQEEKREKMPPRQDEKND